MGQRKELVIVAGANGTGKTTFALEYVAQHGVEYLGADAIAETLAPGNPTSVKFQAGRRFLAMVEDRLLGNDSFIIETTLSGIGIRRTIEKARRSQFAISIIFLFLDSPDICISRIEQRVRKGGHHVPEEDVRRRFVRCVGNFWNVYRELADSWVVVYNATEQAQDVAAGSNDQFVVRDTALYSDFTKLVEASKL